MGPNALYTVSGDFTLRSTPLVSQGEKWSVSTKTWQSDLALCRDHILLSSGAMAGTVGTVKVWKGPHLSRSMTCEGGTIRCLSASDSDLWAGSDDGTLRLWDVETGTVRASQGLGKSSIRNICRHHAFVAAGDESGTMWLCDQRAPRVVDSWTIEPASALQGIASLHNYRLFSASRSNNTLFHKQDVAEILEWDSRRLRGSQPLQTIGHHGDRVIGLQARGEDVLVSASKDGGCAVWKGDRLAAEFRVNKTVPTAFCVRDSYVYVVTSDRIARDYDTSRLVLGEEKLVRPCGACSGTGVAATNLKSVCMRCNSTGRFLFDEEKVEEAEEPEVEKAEIEEPVAETKGDPGLPAWLTRWLPQSLENDAHQTVKIGGDRFHVGDLVVLAPMEEKKTVFQREGIQPALTGNDVGVVVQDDRSKVPYLVRGPAHTTSWFEPWELLLYPKPPTPPSTQ